MDVTLQYFEDCPNWRRADERLRAVADEYDLAVTYQRVETPEEAESLAFAGSPTILVDGRDPFAKGDEVTGLACRVYETPDGRDVAPTVSQLRAAVS